MNSECEIIVRFGNWGFLGVVGSGGGSDCFTLGVVVFCRCILVDENDNVVGHDNKYNCEFLRTL